MRPSPSSAAASRIIADEQGPLRASTTMSVARVPLTHAGDPPRWRGYPRDRAQSAWPRRSYRPDRLADLHPRWSRRVDRLPRPPTPAINRLWLRTVAEADEHLWGGGEQMSYFDLRGRRFPLWTSEPGVGRDKSTLITFQADQRNHGGGGDYYTTNYPQPTPTSPRAATPCTWRPPPGRPSTSGAATSTRSRPGRSRRARSSCWARTASQRPVTRLVRPFRPPAARARLGAAGLPSSAWK